MCADHDFDDDADALRRAVRAGAVGEPEGDGGAQLEARESGLQTGDPAGFTLADTLDRKSVV